jgi:uncharacterized protein (TIGR00255 family)
MLHSMTGFGSAQQSTPAFNVAVEVRSVNNRHLKLSVRGSDPYSLFESEFEKVVRKSIRRGSVHVQVRVERQTKSNELTLNADALKSYLTQLRAVAEPAELPGLLAGVLALPGIAPQTVSFAGLPEDEWPVVERTLETALKALDAVRRTEGKAMATELRQLHTQLETELRLVRENLPRATANYRERILDRVRQAVSEAGITIEADQLIREVAIFADRTDVAEEVTRFAAHLVQYAEVVEKGSSDSAGRRLEFIVQEMGREINTMGSKAGDVAISRHVVEMKAVLERIRELILNVE